MRGEGGMVVVPLLGEEVVGLQVLGLEGVVGREDGVGGWRVMEVMGVGMMMERVGGGGLRQRGLTDPSGMHRTNRRCQAVALTRITPGCSFFGGI